MGTPKQRTLQDVDPATQAGFSQYIQAIFAGDLSSRNPVVVVKNALAMLEKDKGITREALFATLPQLSDIPEEDLDKEGAVNADPRWQFMLGMRRAMRQELEDQVA